MNRENQIDIIRDLLVEFDEMGFVPSTTVPDHEAYAIKWRAEITKALEDYFKQSEWISVDERLPEDDGRTVLYYDGEDVDACYFFFGDFNTIDTYESSVICGVTHWMPLPEPPKMKGGAE